MAKRTRNTAGRKYSLSEYIPPSEYDAILAVNRWVERGQEIREIFLRCRQNFCREKAQSDQFVSSEISAVWDGGQDRLGRQHQPIWPKIAEFCDTHAVDPELWIEAVFALWGDLSPPQPTVFLSPAYLSYYEQRRPLLIQQLELRLRGQWELFQTLVHIWDTSRKDTNKAIRAVLTNFSVQLMPLMRYLLAKTADQQDVVEVVEEAARIQTRSLRTLLSQTKWGALLPREWIV